MAYPPLPGVPVEGETDHISDHDAINTWMTYAETVSALPGPEGPEGPQGPTGNTGPQGPQGPKGDTGETTTIVGEFGVSKTPDQLPSNGYIPAGWDSPGNPAYQMKVGEALFYTGAPVSGYAHGDLFIFDANDTTPPAGWINAGNLRGPEGPQGPQGPQGVKGDQGLTGTQGPQGIQGPVGDTGPTGGQGPKGDDGAAGASGPAGDPGPAGAGLQPGGVIGDIPTKRSALDYDTEWVMSRQVFVDAVAPIPSSGQRVGDLWVQAAGISSLAVLPAGSPAPVAALDFAPRPAMAVVYSSTFPSALKPGTSDPANMVWQCTGTADQVPINAALDAVAAAGNGMVLLLGNVFNITGSIKLRTGVYLRGESVGCQIRALASIPTGMLALYDNVTHAVEASHFYLDGNSQPSTHGIYINNYGANQAFNSKPPTNPDPNHRLHDMIIKYMGNAANPGHGIITWDWAVRAGMTRDIRIQSVTGCGVIAGSADSHWLNVEIGSSGTGGSGNEGSTPSGANPTFDAVGQGFVFYNGNNLVANCKAWYSRGHGFYVRTNNTQINDCQTQDNYRDGFKDTSGRNVYSGCMADSNNQSAGGYAGFRFTATGVSAQGLLSFTRQSSDVTWEQDYGYVVTGATYSLISGVSKANRLAGVSGATPTGSTIQIVQDSGGK